MSAVKILFLQVNVISQIRHSAAAGHTVLMCQTDGIHESFYDLFNQRFRTLKDPKHGIRFYANMAIGAHSKPCRVNPEFQCLVIIRQSELKHTPAPFLNRFEKYFLSHKILYQNVIGSLPPCLQTILTAAYNKVIKLNFHTDEFELVTLYITLCILMLTVILIKLYAQDQ